MLSFSHWWKKGNNIHNLGILLHYSLPGLFFLSENEKKNDIAVEYIKVIFPQKIWAPVGYISVCGNIHLSPSLFPGVLFPVFRLWACPHDLFWPMGHWQLYYQQELQMCSCNCHLGSLPCKSIPLPTCFPHNKDKWSQPEPGLQRQPAEFMQIS